MKLIATDERIAKKSREIYSHLYPLILIFTIVTIGFKYVLLTQNTADYILEFTALLASIGYLLIRTAIVQIPLFKRCDECINDIQNHYRMHSFYICFITYILGGFILMMVFDKSILAYIYIPVWLIPSCIATIYLIREGLFIWGSKKNKSNGIKSLKLNVIIQSIFFGIIMNWTLFKCNPFHVTTLFCVAVSSLVFGVPLYFIMKFMINKSELYSKAELGTTDSEDKTNM